MVARREFQTLQAGRALAAFAVVLHHAGLAARSFGHPFVGQAVLDRGYLGVDFFFVLSGFIIFESTVDRDKSVSDYSRARFRRVFLPYWPIGLAIAVLYTLMPEVSVADHSWSWLPTVTLLPVNSHPALSVAWTLQHEVLFYTIFGLGFFGRFLTLSLALWGVAIVSFWFSGASGVVALAPINLEFLMGVGVASLRRRGWGSSRWYVLALVPLVAWVLTGADRDLSILVGLSLALMMLPTIRLEEEGKVRVSPWLGFWGAASYSLYLVHGLAISIGIRCLPYREVPSIIVTAILVSLTAGAVYHSLIERPLLTGKFESKRKAINSGQAPRA